MRSFRRRCELKTLFYICFETIIEIESLEFWTMQRSLCINVIGRLSCNYRTLLSRKKYVKTQKYRFPLNEYFSFLKYAPFFSIRHHLKYNVRVQGFSSSYNCQTLLP